jgi:hypothetical protein
MRPFDFLPYVAVTVAGLFIVQAAVSHTWKEGVKRGFQAVMAVLFFVCIGSYWLATGEKPDETAYRLIICPFLALDRCSNEKSPTPPTTQTTVVQKQPSLLDDRPRRITLGVRQVEFFDPATGQPRVWYSRAWEGGFELFDRRGYHPTTSEALFPVTREVVAEIMKRLGEEEDARKKVEEQRRAAEDKRIAATEAARRRAEDTEKQKRLDAPQNDVALSSSDTRYFYVANTRPPDAFLALRSHPTSQEGLRIMEMPNGTALKVLQRRADGWWHVRVVSSGQEGWALSGQGGAVWIACCATLATDSGTKQAQAEMLGFKTPSNNIYCQIRVDSLGYLRCDIQEITNIVPPRPRECRSKWGNVYAIKKDGSSGQLLCPDDIISHESLPTQPYGSTWRGGDYTCNSEPTGVRCINPLGHGFSLSRNSQRVF